MADNVTQPTDISPEDFIEGVENNRRQKDARVLLELFSRVTGMRAKMWGPSIIGFGTYTYTLANGKQGTMLRTGFSPRKQNMVLYIMTGFKERAELREKLGKHKTGKSCLYINKLDDVDLNVVEELIKTDLEVMSARYPD